MSYQKANVDDLESSTRPNRNPPNTPEKSQLKKWLGIAGAIALLIVIATAIGYTIYHTQSKTADEKAKKEADAKAEGDKDAKLVAEAKAKAEAEKKARKEADEKAEEEEKAIKETEAEAEAKAVRKIEMGIHSSAGCGSEADGVRIEVKSKTDLCITEPYEAFSAGETLDWSEEQLGNCTTAQFDPMEEKISVWIKTNIHDAFCPISVKIVLDDFNTYYMLRLPEEPWHNDDDKQNKTYTAEKGGSEKAMSIVISE